MALARDKWVRRFIIPETARHKRGFTIYKVTSVVFLKSSHEEVSKVSVWKRYNDFKKLYSELNALYSKSQIKESFPPFPKSKFFGRFEAEVIEERRKCALKFLEFIERHSFLYSSDIFIKFFETSHSDHCLNDCSQSISSDTSEEDCHAFVSSVPTDETACESTIEHKSKSIKSSTRKVCSILPTSVLSLKRSQKVHESNESKELRSVMSNDCDLKVEKSETSDTASTDKSTSIEDNVERITLGNENPTYDKDKNCDKNVGNDITNEKCSVNVQVSSIDMKSNIACDDSSNLTTAHDGSDLSQFWTDSTQYILIAAAHMSAAYRHEAIKEYEEAFTQYKMGISSLSTGIQSDSDKLRAEIIKEKISKYSERAERLYNRHLNCNISLLSKPVSELQHYKVLKIMRTVMVVMDVRQYTFNIVKAIEKSSTNKESVSNYVLRGQVPFMVRLHACIETETTIFLILPYASRGKLWDFIMAQYKLNNNVFHKNISIENDLGKICGINDEKLKQSSVKEGIECTEILVENLNYESTNPKVQVDTSPLTVEEEQELHSALPTTELLEKAQILLQSVNTTLKESNTVVNRLNKSKHLMNEDNTILLNMKNSTQPDRWNIILSNVNETSNGTHDMNKNECQHRKSSLIENISDKSLIANSLSENDIRKTDSEYITDNWISNSCKDLTLSQRKSMNSSLNNIRNSSFSEQYNGDKTNDTANIYDLNGILNHGYRSKVNDCITPDDEIHYLDTALLTDSIKNKGTEIEEELWKIPESVICHWAAEILLALEALHQQEVIVFDLKPDNILLDVDDQIQLTYIVPHRSIDLSKPKPPYASPELCMFLPTIPLTPATDIWSFGVILYELIVGNKFQATHPGIFHSHSIVNLPNRISENAKSLLLNVLKYQPNQRMTIAEIKQHPFFNGIDWSNLVKPI